MADDTSDQKLLDFGFGFNDSNFSDRIFRIEIGQPETEGSKTVANTLSRKSNKRGRSGDDEASNSDDSNQSEDDGSRVRIVKTLHINSLLLAAKSPFFKKLFSNGMVETEQRHVSMRINEFEEAAFMELLRFMYSNTLTSNTTQALLDVLLIADKLEVASCMTHCSRLLRDLPMTTESALLYLNLPSSVIMRDVVKDLTTAAKQFLVVRYQNLSQCQDEAMSLPLAGIDAILSSDDLHATSEDEVYDFAVKWTKTHYQKPEEQREIFSTSLGPNIRFSYMTCQKLSKILACNDFYNVFAIKSAIYALLFKAGAPYRQQIHVIKERTSTNRRFTERAYIHHPIKIVQLEHPHQECVVYLDLKRERCASLFPSDRVLTQIFYMMGQPFHLIATCNKRQNLNSSFGFYLFMAAKGSGTFDVEYDFSVRLKPTEKYVSKGNGMHTFTAGESWGHHSLLNNSWDSFMAEDCVYFIKGVLHLRVELTIKRKEN